MDIKIQESHLTSLTILIYLSLSLCFSLPVDCKIIKSENITPICPKHIPELFIIEQ